jgi:hypothetical protein
MMPRENNGSKPALPDFTKRLFYMDPVPFGGGNGSDKASLAFLHECCENSLDCHGDKGYCLPCIEIIDGKYETGEAFYLDKQTCQIVKILKI